MLPWARSEVQGDRPAGQLPVEGYSTAQGEEHRALDNRVVPPFRSSLENFPPLAAPSESGASDRLSPTPPSGTRGQFQFGSSNWSDGVNTGIVRAEPQVRQGDWEEVQSGSPQTSGRRQAPEGSDEITPRRQMGKDAEKHVGKDEQLEITANTEAAKQCYFDLELGEAGPASIGHDMSSGRERKWHRFRSGATYDGEWLGGVRDGLGKQCWPDGTVYVGEWRRGRAGGRGEIRHYDGDIYTGEWINGRAHGSGVFRHQGSHAIYEGEFRCDMREGMGTELWVDGSWYAGQFRKGAKHGFGEHRWPMPSGTYYIGNWRANELMGPGRYVVQDGPSYQGQWMNSVIDGAGVYSWPDGQQFEGQYHLDRKHGFGSLVTPDGEIRQGWWAVGKRSDHDPTEKSS